MNKLWCDLKTDAEKADYILSGKAYAAGVISHMIQADVAMAFTKCANYAAEISRLREENERLRKDAERYRWLRNYGDASHFAGRMFVTRYIGSATIPAYHGGALDKAIDAARGAE